MVTEMCYFEPWWLELICFVMFKILVAMNFDEY